jgi:hypothetical protein
MAALCGVIAMAACGGGSSNNGGGGGSSSITGVTASCSPSTVLPGQTSQCTSMVTGTGNFSSAVTWTASLGTITSAGLYTAPFPPNNAQATITATSTQDTSKSGTTTISVNLTMTSNVLPIVVDAGPSGSGFSYVNGPFVSVSVCTPGTTTCQTIDHVLVDTGSSGLRIVGSLLSVSLPVQKDGNGNTIGECTQFADGFSWGQLASADVQMAGEKASSVPIQLIGTSVLPNIPSACSSTGSGENTVATLGANGILGVGLFQQDCGTYCRDNNSNGFYYTCPSNNCSATTLSLTNQVQNPVSMLPQDNNGVVINLPVVPLNTGSVNPTGSLFLGIDTQTNNALGSATLYTTTAIGDFQQVTFNGTNYSDSCSADSNGHTTGNCAYLDCGSNAWFILDANTLGVNQCSGQNSAFYCENPTKIFTATVKR